MTFNFEQMAAKLGVGKTVAMFQKSLPPNYLENLDSKELLKIWKDIHQNLEGFSTLEEDLLAMALTKCPSIADCALIGKNTKNRKTEKLAIVKAMEKARFVGLAGYLNFMENVNPSKERDKAKAEALHLVKSVEDCLATKDMDFLIKAVDLAVSRAECIKIQENAGRGYEHIAAKALAKALSLSETVDECLDIQHRAWTVGSDIIKETANAKAVELTKSIEECLKIGTTPGIAKAVKLADTLDKCTDLIQRPIGPAAKTALLKKIETFNI